jgi:hypothetical protein
MNIMLQISVWFLINHFVCLVNESYSGNNGIFKINELQFVYAV